MNFSFGLMASVLMNYSYDGVEDNKVINCLLGALEIEEMDSDNTSSLKRCKANIPSDIAEKARSICLKKRMKDVENNLAESLPIYVNTDNKKEEIIESFTEIIKNSENVEDCVCGWTKESLLRQQNYDIFQFLTILLLYSVGYTINKDGKDSLRILDDSFFLRVEASSMKVNVGSHISGTDNVLSFTLDENSFHSVFSEIDLPCDLIDKGDVRFFCLSMNNGCFDYTGLRSYFDRIIGNYVFDRLKMNDFSRNDSELGVNAMRVFRKVEQSRIKDCNPDEFTSSQMGDIILYAFLENILKAPKVMSLVEFQQKKDIEVTSHGTHLLRLPDGKFQLVVAVSAICKTLLEGMDRAIEEIKYIKQHFNEYRRIASPSSLRGMVDSQTMGCIDYSFSLTDIRKSNNLSNSFGVFIGFDAPEDLNDENYKDTLKEIVMGLIPSIKMKLDENDLKRFPIYIYLLPFNDAILDERRIMESFME